MLVIYRATPSSNPDKNRPIQGDKVDLVTMCFRSFLLAFRGIEYDLKVLLDKPNSRMRDLFDGFDVEETFYGGLDEGNIGSFHRQLDLVNESSHDYFLLVEDDYYFLPDAGLKVVDLDFPLFTPYLHPGYFSEDVHSYDKKVVHRKGRHWMSVISTTLTFGGMSHVIKQEIDTMKKYGWADHPMFVDITRRHELYTPIPTLATHMEVEHLATDIDWHSYF